MPAGPGRRHSPGSAISSGWLRFTDLCCRVSVSPAKAGVQSCSVGGQTFPSVVVRCFDCAQHDTGGPSVCCGNDAQRCENGFVLGTFAFSWAAYALVCSKSAPRQGLRRPPSRRGNGFVLVAIGWSFIDGCAGVFWEELVVFL